MSTPRFKFPDGELDAWVVLGDVTDRSVRVWARNPAGKVRATLWVATELVAQAEIAPDPEHDHIGAAVLEPASARPDADFEVRVGDQVRRSRFAPPPGDRSSFTFAFGSCHQPFTEPLDGGRVERHPGAAIYPPIARLLAQNDARFALWLGDQVYSDGIASMNVRERMPDDPSITDEDLIDTYRHLYRGYFNERGYRELNEAVPAYLMWDDHDIFDGWGSLLDRKPFDERVYRAAEAAFREYQQLRNPAGATDGGAPYGYSFWRGDVGFHVPDLRSERDFHARRVMGDAGWSRLEAFFAEATERAIPTIFLGLSVPLVHASPALMGAMERLPTSSGRDVRDRWSVPHFAAERTRLLELIFGWQSAAPARQVIVLSGDVHVGAAFNVKPRTGRGRFAQWTSSALSTPDGLPHILANQLITRFVRLGEKELHVWRRGLATSNNVGLVNVEPQDGGGHEISLTVHQYDARKDVLKVSLTDVSAPARR